MRRPAWTYYTSYYLPKKFCTVYRDDALGIQLQVEVKRKWIFFEPKQKTYYFIDGYKRIFRTEASMMRKLKRIWSRRKHSVQPRRVNRASAGEGRGAPTRSYTNAVALPPSHVPERSLTTQ